MSKQSMTAAELLARLANDPRHQLEIRKKESQRDQLETELIADEQELVSELHAVGVEVQSVWDLVNTNATYRPAIPILARHLDISHHPRTVQGIVRALTTPDAKGLAFRGLVKAFKGVDENDSELKWLLGAAIAETCMADDLDEVVELANDVRHGQGRAFLPLGLVAASKEYAIPILESWTKDTTLAQNARKAIQLLR